MSEQFYTILTNIGKAKIANAAALNTKLNIVSCAVGDGNGAYYEPMETQTALKHEVWRKNISAITIDEENPNWILVQAIIPATDGGFMIREAAIFDDANNMIAVGKFPETYKPVAGDGSTKDLDIKMILEVSNASSVTLTLDPTVIIATKKDIQNLNNSITTINNSINVINASLSDFVYQTAGGTGTALTVTIKGTLVNGYPITFIASANNSGAATTINGKKLYKPGTTTAPNLIAGKAYTVWYNQAGDCFFIKASAEGDAIAANVLAGKKFSNDNDTGLVGTLDLSNLVSGNIKSGVSINGVSGKASVVDTSDANASAGQILNGQTAYVNGNKITGNISLTNPTWADQCEITQINVGANSYNVQNNYAYMKVPSNTYLNNVSWIFHYEGDLFKENIVSGKTIFGITGNATPLSMGGKRYASGSNITVPSTATVTVNLPFAPSIVYLDGGSSDKYIYFSLFGKTYSYSSKDLLQFANYYVTPISNGFAIRSNSVMSPTFTYYAWE